MLIMDYWFFVLFGIRLYMILSGKWWYIKFKCLNCEESWELLIELFINIIVMREFDI